MSTPLPDVRVGDVWASRTGKNKVRVDAITHSRYVSGEVRWSSLTISGDSTNTSGCCSIANFSRRRRLIERDGKPVQP